MTDTRTACRAVEVTPNTQNARLTSCVERVRALADELGACACQEDECERPTIAARIHALLRDSA